MAGEKGEQVRSQSKTKEQNNPSEILDLKKYGALYGRFFLASLPGAKINDILDPDKKVEFNDLTITLLRAERNFNPIFENFSLNERKKRWEDFKPSKEYPTAYDQWLKEFTGFMVNIQDPQREKALGIILRSDKKAKEFTVDDADQLFKTFCKGKSDIEGFLERVMEHLIVTSPKGINPTNLQQLSPHLEWIASGLFGKETASHGITRLIEFESATYNSKDKVVKILNSNKARISAPLDDEKRVLGFLRNSLPVPQKEEEVPAKPPPSTPLPPPLKKEEEEGVPPKPSPEVGSEAKTKKEIQTVSLEATNEKENLFNKIDFALARAKPSTFTFLFVLPPNALKQLLVEGRTSILAGKSSNLTFKVAEIKATEDTKDGETLLISGLQITKPFLGSITLDLVLRDTDDGFGAEITKFSLSRMIRSKKASFQQEVGKQLENINLAIEQYLNERIDFGVARFWRAKHIGILNGKLYFGFERKNAPPEAERTQ